MSCERYADALLETALGEPAPPELLSHLRACVACGQALERERGLVGRIEGELREAVSVTPSPALLPRVRAQVRDVAADSRPWRLFWLLPVAAGLVAVAAAVALRQSSEPAAIQARSAVSAAVAESPRPIPEARVSVPSLPTRPFVRQPRLARAKTEPEVLVPPGDEELVRRFVVALRARRPDETGIVAGETQPGSPALAIPLLEEIPPLEMKPLTAGTDPKESIDD